MFAVMWAHWDWHWGVVLAFAYVPFQLIADATTRLLAEETSARERLAAANAELEATRELLAQSTRMAERARIGRELHDVLGHHLTALSLNLEIASHRTEGEALDRVATAQSLTKLLLGDVRAVVGALRSGSDQGLDLPAALRKLAEGIPRPRVHVEVAPGFSVDDPADAEVVLRCAQEIVTNAVRHAEAENVWLDVARRPSGIEIRARDDGRGASAIHSGNGLSGMRERFEQRGGALSFSTAPGRGFSVAATLPVAGAS
jgi:signal transduction histidine kinase